MPLLAFITLTVWTILPVLRNESFDILNDLGEKINLRSSKTLRGVFAAGSLRRCGAEGRAGVNCCISPKDFVSCPVKPLRAMERAFCGHRAISGPCLIERQEGKNTTLP